MPVLLRGGADAGLGTPCCKGASAAQRPLTEKLPMDRSDTPSCRIAAKAKHDDPMRMCIAGFRSTMEAIRHHESTRGGMNHTPTLFLLGVDAAVRHSLEGVVAAGGCSLEYHSTARSFLQAYDPTRPGCVVLDIATVASDASELQKKLSSGNPPLPIIILAGEGPLPQISRGFSLGPVDLLRKPVDAELCRRDKRPGTRSRGPLPHRPHRRITRPCRPTHPPGTRSYETYGSRAGTKAHCGQAEDQHQNGATPPHGRYAENAGRFARGIGAVSPHLE